MGCLRCRATVVPKTEASGRRVARKWFLRIGRSTFCREVHPGRPGGYGLRPSEMSFAEFEVYAGRLAFASRRSPTWFHSCLPAPPDSGWSRPHVRLRKGRPVSHLRVTRVAPVMLDDSILSRKDSLARSDSVRSQRAGQRQAAVAVLMRIYREHSGCRATHAR